MTWEEFETQLANLTHLQLTQTQKEQFHLYLSLLQEWNEKMNLTAIVQEEEIIEKHFFDSLFSCAYFDYQDQSLLDIGSGAGFPGIPLKIVFPDLCVTLLEPTAKRVTFLHEVVTRLQLKGIVIVNERAEDYVKKARSYYDVVTARAVAHLPLLMELSVPLLRVGGTFIALKGAKGKEEKEDAKHASEELQLQLESIQEWQLSSGDTRINLFYRKKREIALKYPRPYGQMKKKPL